MWTKSLLVGEVGLATALLVGAGVLVTSFVKLSAIDAGLDVRHVVTAWITLPEFSFTNRDARTGFSQALQHQMEQLPGVERVALSLGLPPEAGGNTSDPVQTDVPGAPERRLNVLQRRSRVLSGLRHHAAAGPKLPAKRRASSSDRQ
jgi:hypothetical protein